MPYIDNTLDEDTNKNDNSTNLVVDPLLVEGTKKYLIEFTFKTNFINLLSFLRELEFQENIILLDDMNLKLVTQNINNKNNENPKGMLDVKLRMTLYGEN